MSFGAIDDSLGALPARLRGAVPGGRGDSRRLSWQREMERAQVTAWFKATRHSHVAATPVSAGTSEAPGRNEDRVPTIAAVAAAQAAPGLPHARAAGGAAANPWVLPTKNAIACSAIAAPAQPPAPAGTQRAQGRALHPSPPGGQTPMAGAGHVSIAAALPGANPPAPSVPAPHAPASAALVRWIASQLSRPQPVRVHLQQHDDEVRLWLGIDARAQGQVPELVRALGRWLGEQGLRLRSVVCNGRVHFDAGADLGAPPPFQTSHPSTRRP